MPTVPHDFVRVVVDRGFSQKSGANGIAHAAARRVYWFNLRSKASSAVRYESGPKPATLATHAAAITDT